MKFRLPFLTRRGSYDPWRGPLRLVALQPPFRGQEPPNGTSWTCLHPDCVAEWGQHGLWGSTEGMIRHAASHPEGQQLALIYHPDNYAGDLPNPWYIAETLLAARDSGEPIMIDLRRFNWNEDAVAPLSDDYHGISYVLAADDHGRPVIVTESGRTIQLGKVGIRSIRRLLPGEAAALGLDGACEPERSPASGSS